MFQKKLWFLSLALLLIVAACTPAGNEPGAAPADDGAEQVGPEAIPAARQALADFLGVAPDTLEMEKVEDAQWGDACLGLGGPAESCAAVVTAGYAVTFTVAGESHVVRTDLAGNQARVEAAGGEAPAGDIPGPDLNGALLFFQRSGGLDGQLLTVRIYADGTIERAFGDPAPDLPVATQSTEPAAVETLLSALTEAGYFGLERSYLPEDTCCDRYLYLISVQGEQGDHTVEALEATDGTPDDLWQSIAVIEGFINEAFGG